MIDPLKANKRPLVFSLKSHAHVFRTLEGGIPIFVALCMPNVGPIRANSHHLEMTYIVKVFRCDEFVDTWMHIMLSRIFCAPSDGKSLEALQL